MELNGHHGCNNVVVTVVSFLPYPESEIELGWGTDSQS